MRWLIPSLQNKLIALQISPEYICCSLIEPYQSSKKSVSFPQFELKSYQRISINSFQFQESMLCNPTYLKRLVNSFLKLNNLSSVFGAMTITGAGIDQQFIIRPNASPQRQDFSNQLKETIQWDYTYLYPAKDEHGFIFYRCSIPQELIMQYHLFAISQRLELIALTTPSSALFNLYKYIHAQAFSTNKLAYEMEKNNNNVEKLFSFDILKKLLHIPLSIKLTIEEELPYLSTALGLLIATNFYGSKRNETD